jgi:hypothetical protein
MVASTRTHGAMVFTLVFVSLKSAPCIDVPSHVRKYV